MGFILEVVLLADLAAVRQWLVDHGVVADIAAATVAIPNGTPIERARMHAVRLRLDQIPAAVRDRMRLLDVVNRLNVAHRRAFVIEAGLADPGADMAALNAAVVQAVDRLAPLPGAPALPPAPVPAVVAPPAPAAPLPAVPAAVVPPPPGGHVVVPVQPPRVSLTTLTEKILLVALVLALLALTVFATRTWLSGDNEEAKPAAAAAGVGAASEPKAGPAAPAQPPSAAPPFGGGSASVAPPHGVGTTVNVSGPPPVTVNVNVAGGSPCLAGMRSLGFAEVDAKAGCGVQ